MQNKVRLSLYKEIATGVHNLEVLQGTTQKGHSPQDFIIVTADEGERRYFHVFLSEPADRDESFSRLRNALDYMPVGETRNHTSAFLYISSSDEQVVASLIVSKNPDGSTCVLFGYHGDIPRLQACAILNEAGNELIEGYSKQN